MVSTLQFNSNSNNDCKFDYDLRSKNDTRDPKYMYSRLLEIAFYNFTQFKDS